MELVKSGGSIFCFKQKTAYEISLGLVGSEMCIRDRQIASWRWIFGINIPLAILAFLLVTVCAKESYDESLAGRIDFPGLLLLTCLLYTSDAADDTPSLDLGCRRLIKKI
ncbi:hypothetical protein [Lactobacillus rhamnosus DSM 14870] [Lacticaseibacillus rhamnosus]|nr:hypothetical protein [Lactobacillus rhamnosus DSM 14870] [Lacticaseibacillus rhamnosus]